MPEQLLTPREVAALLKIHPDSVRSFAKRYAETFPRKVKLSPGVTGPVRYRASDVERFISDRIAASAVK